MSKKINNLAIEDQIKLGKEGFQSPREQYVYSAKVTSPKAIAAIWGLSEGAVYQRVSSSEGKEHDWRRAREYHRAQVAEAVSRTIADDAAEETEGFVATAQAVLGMLMVHVTRGSGQKELDHKQTTGFARALKLLVDMQDQLSGYGKIQELAHGRRVENQWFFQWAVENIDDPQKIMGLARSIRDRMIAMGHVTTGDYGSVFDMAQSAKTTLSEVQSEIRRIAEGSKKLPAKDVSPKKRRQVKDPGKRRGRNDDEG